jgi:CRP/FNR family cyclic AMP-dependent transcriptional regulator
MKERFEGKVGHRRLVDALVEQKIIRGDRALAEEIADKAELFHVNEGTNIIAQGGDDNDVYFILAGSFKIIINGRQMATRFSGDHVGEMAAVQPTQRRAATVTAAEDSVICRLPEPALAELGRRYPDLWRNFAKELARRLEQRNAFVTTLRKKIRVFIISSVEALEIARAIQNAFEHDPFSVVIWTDGVFRASQYPIESLENEVDQSDFAIAIAQPDDHTESRGASAHAPRDNVIFELGFFMGRLGRQRALLVEPRGEAPLCRRNI